MTSILDNGFSQTSVVNNTETSGGGSIDPSTDVVCKSLTAETITASNNITLNNSDVHDNMFRLSSENTSDLVSQGILFESKSSGVTKHSGLCRKAGGGHYLIDDTSTSITGATDVSALSLGKITCGDIKCLSLTTDRDLGTGIDTDYINLRDFGMNSTGSIKVNDNTLIIYGNVDSNASFETDGGATIRKNLNVGTKTGIATFSDTRQATDATTGAVVINGGVGIGKNVYVGSSGLVNVLSTTESQSTYSGAILVNGGIGVQKTIYTNRMRISSNDNSSTTNSGAMVVYGGEAVTKDLYVGGTVKTINTADSTDVSTGSIIASGGIATAKTLYVGGDIKMSGTGNMYYPGNGGLYHDQYGNMYFQSSALNSYSWHLDSNSNGGSSILFQVYNNINGNPTCRLNGNIDSSSPNSGAVIVTGGMGIGKSLFVGGTAQSTSSLTGSVVIAGGVGIAKNLYVGGSISSRADMCSYDPTAGSNKCAFVSWDGGNNTGNIGAVNQGVGYLDIGVDSQCKLFVRNNTQATNTLTGGLIVTGGMGVGKDIFCSGYIHARGMVGGNEREIQMFYDSANDRGVLYAQQPGVAGKPIYLWNSTLQVPFTTESTDASTGTITCGGGVGIGKNLNVTGQGNFAGQGNFNAGTASTSKNTGALRVTGGIGCTGTVNCSLLGADSQVLAQATTQSTNVSTGSLVVSGGAGFAQNVYVGGTVNVVNTADASSSMSGAIIVTGGLGVSKSMYVGNNMYLPTVGGTATALNYYETYTHTTNMTGAFSLTNVDFVLTRVGNMVTMRYPTKNGTLVSSMPEYAVTVLPARFRPATDLLNIILITNNNTYADGSLIIYADGNIYFMYNTPAPAPFSTGYCGWSGGAFSWCL